MRIDRNKIEGLLAKKGMRKKDLAEEIGTTAPYLSVILGRRTCAIKTAAKIAKALDVHPLEILKED